MPMFVRIWPFIYDVIREQRRYCIHAIFSNSSAELILGLDWDQSWALRLMFGLRQKAQPRSQPKSEVTHCRYKIDI